MGKRNYKYKGFDIRITYDGDDVYYTVYSSSGAVVCMEVNTGMDSIRDWCDDHRHWQVY